MFVPCKNIIVDLRRSRIIHLDKIKHKVKLIPFKDKIKLGYYNNDTINTKTLIFSFHTESECNEFSRFVLNVSKYPILYDFTDSQKLLTGCMGNIYTGVFRDGVKYIIKELNMSDRKQNYKAILNEINIMTELSKNEFCVPLKGVLRYKKTIFLIIDYKDKGDLFNYIHYNKKRITIKERNDILLQIINGIESLDKMNILHRDLKLENILIDTSLKVYISDFGLSKRLQSFDQRCFTKCGTFRYFAPEVFTNDGYGTSINFWQFGCMVFETVYHKHPFSDQNHNFNTDTFLNDICRKKILKSYNRVYCSEYDEIIDSLLEPLESNRASSWNTIKKSRVFLTNDIDDKYIIRKVEKNTAFIPIDHQCICLPLEKNEKEIIGIESLLY
jgi:serine/threonine protein kinase